MSYLDGLSGGVEGAGQGAALLGSMGPLGANPFVAGGTLLGTTALGVLSGLDPAKRREGRRNARLGGQEIELNDIKLAQLRQEQQDEKTKRDNWKRFGMLFSRYLGGYSRARPGGQEAFAADVGG